jgi:hypothetical protein
METFIDKIESCGFECEAGNIEKSNDWAELKDRANLWIVLKRGQNICHTAGKGGWRFTACTSKEEAEWLADLCNKERYSGRKICGVAHLLDVNR